MLVCVASCKKDEPAEQIALSGKALYATPLFGVNNTMALKNQLILVKDSLTGTLYPLNTDSTGSFYLPGWSAGQIFNIEAKLSHNDSDEYKVEYVDSKIVSGNEIKNVTLTAKIDTLHYKALLLSVKDIYGGRIPGANVHIYTSKAIAIADTGFVGHGAIAPNLKTSNNGNCLLMQLPGDSIFIKSNYKADTVINFRSDILALKLTTAFTDTASVVR